MDQRARRA